MAVEISIEGLGEFTNKIKLIQKKLPDKSINTIDKHSRRVTREYKKRVKSIKNTGNLSKGMRAMETMPESGDWVGGVKSFAPHFHLIEYGHKVVPIKSRGENKQGNGLKKKDKKGRKNGGATHVPGRYYLRKSLGASEKLFRKDVEKMLEESMDILS